MGAASQKRTLNSAQIAGQSNRGPREVDISGEVGSLVLPGSILLGARGSVCVVATFCTASVTRVRTVIACDLQYSGMLLKISPLVAQALNEGRPVVALESTIISHGKLPSYHDDESFKVITLVYPSHTSITYLSHIQSDHTGIPLSQTGDF